jgi:serine/threonine protein kinase
LSVYMVFPYMDHDLAGLLENERVKLQPSHIKLYMKQLLEGTEYMHRVSHPSSHRIMSACQPLLPSCSNIFFQNHILHRDMKAANLLISNDGSLRIADFGLARAFDPDVGLDRGKERKYTNCVVTRWYRPPELLLGARQYGGEVDIWGIGYASLNGVTRQGQLTMFSAVFLAKCSCASLFCLASLIWTNWKRFGRSVGPQISIHGRIMMIYQGARVSRDSTQRIVGESNKPTTRLCYSLLFIEPASLIVAMQHWSRDL